MELTEHERAAFQYAIITDGMLEQYTAEGWEFVQLIDVPGTEMVAKTDVFEHSVAAQHGYQPPPLVNVHTNQSGQFVRWSATKALVRRDREAHNVQSSFVMLNMELRNELKVAKADRELAVKQLEEVASAKTRLEDEVNQQRKTIKEVALELENMTIARDLTKKHLNDVELDIGKREMDRILGRFPNPSERSVLDLGEEPA